jgi:acyl-coenzyme A thioesterase PaaI-like protein
VPLTHHELCFGCGRTNLFGLLLEVEPSSDDTVRGRCFIKQDHQGAERGYAHQGIIAAALSEAIALAAGPDAQTKRLEVQFHGPVPVGAFLDVEADTRRATATSEGALVATATASV